jgi:hypothetical protein
VADNETLTELGYLLFEQATPLQLMDEVGAWLSFLITCATVLTTVPLAARGCSQSRNALNSGGLIEGAPLSPPQLSHKRWKTRITHPPPELSACCT